MQIDVHTHAFHPRIASRVLERLRGHYGILPVGTGLIEDLLTRARAAGLDRVVVHNAATGPAQVIPANNWAISLQGAYPEVIAFGSLHPGYGEWEAELARLEEKGICGLKFHPEFQGFWMNDPGFYEILEAVSGRFMVMFHVGDRRAPEQNPSCPAKLAAVRRDFPDLVMLAGHFGGYLHWEHALEHVAGLDIYLDTSSAVGFTDPGLIRAIMKKHPSDRLVFGSDYPLFDPGEETGKLRRVLGLSETGLEALFGAARKLFENA